MPEPARSPLPQSLDDSVTRRTFIERILAEATPDEVQSWAYCWLAAHRPTTYTAYRDVKYPWIDDPDWTSPLLEHRGGHHYGGPVDWATGRPA